MKTPATNFEALLGQARDCGLTQEFATAYEINVALDEADCCGGGGGGLPEQSKSTTYTDNGRYTVNPDDGYTLSAVNITVDVDQNLTVISELQLEVAQLEGEIATITSLNISENGTFTPPAGILGYNSIDVNVAGGGGVEGDFGYISTLNIYVPNNEPLPEQYYSLFNDIRAFSIGGKVNSIAFKEGNLTQILNMYNAFAGCSSLTSIIFPEGALTNVNYMSNTFYRCSSLTTITFSNGALTQLTDMPSVFSGCQSLTSIIFPEGALTKVEYMNDAFGGCFSLTYISLPEGALTQVIDIRNIFRFCNSLTSLTFPEGALTQVKYLSNMFEYCTSLQDLTLHNLPNINLTNTGLIHCTSLTLSSLQNIVNALPTTTSGYKCTIGTTNLAKLSDTDIQIATDKGWTLN